MSDYAIDSLAVPAVRYGLGRRTYITEVISSALIGHADALSHKSRHVIIRDITEAEARDGLGDACDAEAWLRLRAELMKPKP